MKKLFIALALMVCATSVTFAQGPAGSKGSGTKQTTVYYCPKCNATATKAGNCPKCNLAMIVNGQYYCPKCYKAGTTQPAECPTCKKEMVRLVVSHQ